MVPLQETQQTIKVLLGSLSTAPVYHLRNHYKVFRKRTGFGDSLQKHFGRSSFHCVSIIISTVLHDAKIEPYRISKKYFVVTHSACSFWGVSFLSPAS